jgi:hypothetical protein
MSVAVACLGLLSAAGYVIVLGISFSFFEITTSWDQRIVAPLFVFITIACVALTWQAARILRARALWWLAVALLLSSSVLNARAARSWAQDAHRNGQGYASTAWRESATIAFVRTLPTALKIYSNDPYAIRFLTGKDAMMIPLDIIPRSGQPNPAYTEELKSMCRASQADEAVLVWLEKNGPWFQATRGAFESTCPTRVRRDLNDGTVYGGARPQASSGPTVVDPPVPRR